MADVACGEGYGSALLASEAARVVGADIAAEAIAHARDRYATVPNLHFEEGSATSLPLSEGSMDAVVSFETIEHLPRDDQSRMIEEFARVLKTDGILVLSTPNPIEYSIARGYHNPFHCHEPERTELAGLLAGAFPAQRWYRQRRYFGSAIWSEAENERYEAWVGDDGPVDRVRPPSAMYFIVVAARSSAALPSSDIGLSLFADRSDTELARLDGHAREAVRLNELLGERSARVQYLDEILAHREAQLAEVKVERDALASAIERATIERNALASQLAERDAAREEISRLERHCEVLRGTIDYRQSLRWWLILPWFRAKLLLRDGRAR